MNNAWQRSGHACWDASGFLAFLPRSIDRCTGDRRRLERRGAMQRNRRKSCPRGILVKYILAAILGIVSLASFAESPIDGTYIGRNQGSQAGCWSGTTTSSTIIDGVLHDGDNVPRGEIHEGSSLTWQTKTRKITVTLNGSIIHAVAVARGTSNCTWTTEQTKRPHPSSSGGQICINGCKRWSAQRDLGGARICALLVFCPRHPLKPPDSEQTLPTLPQPP